MRGTHGAEGLEGPLGQGGSVQTREENRGGGEQEAQQEQQVLEGATGDAPPAGRWRPQPVAFNLQVQLQRTYQRLWLMMMKRRAVSVMKMAAPAAADRATYRGRLTWRRSRRRTGWSLAGPGPAAANACQSPEPEPEPERQLEKLEGGASPPRRQQEGTSCAVIGY